jgi:hypothetical protein
MQIGSGGAFYSIPPTLFQLNLNNEALERMPTIRPGRPLLQVRFAPEAATAFYVPRFTEDNVVRVVASF